MTKQKNILLVGLVVIVIVGGYYAKRRFYDPAHRLSIAADQVKLLLAEGKVQDGDIIFQTSQSAQSIAIQLATHSPYSHCGIIFKKDSNYFVFEAVQPIKQTPLDKWIAKGKDEHYVIKRLKNSMEVLNPIVIQKLKEIGNSFNGKSYDIYFDWSDERMYCSELIWKMYQRATGIEIGKLEKLGDFDLSNEAVKQKLKERYGDNIPLNEIVISPANIYNSDLLRTIKAN